MLGYLSLDIIEHYLFLVAHNFPRASLWENCSLFGTDNVRGQISEHIFAPNGDLFICPVPAVRIFHFQNVGDVTNPAGLTLCILPRKGKSGSMPPSRAKNWRQMSANPVLFPRMSLGSTPGMAADKCIKAKKLYSSLRIYTHKNTFSSQICLKTFSMFYNNGI